jgi:3-phenylpropionate/trans-cinnamate dioxygenase ferredoxin reductase subunit
MTQRVVIVGAGHAAAQLALSLRQYGWEGAVLIVGEEPYEPYQRPTLSKEFMSGGKGENDIFIRTASVYEKHGIELMTGQAVIAINRQEKTIMLGSGEVLSYTKLALCTGARARKISLPGSDLKGVYYLRSLADAKRIKQCIFPGRKVVIIGGGYIGLETAAALNKLDVEVRVLEMQERILARVTASEVSDFYARVHTEEGVAIHTGVSVSAIEDEGQFRVVCCDDGERYEADVVIIGVGVVPNVELAESCGLEVDNGIVVNEFARTKDADIVSAGDCTNHPNNLLSCRLRLESVPNALEQAKTAAASLCVIDKEYAGYPWFWSDQYDLKLQIAGLSQGFDQVVIRGDRYHGRSFVAWYLKKGKLLAADCINRPKEFVVAKQLLVKGLDVDPLKLADESIDVKALLLSP